MNTLPSAVRLSVRDWMHEFRLSFCAVLALASMLAPLLVLHGVHTGVIAHMKNQLTSDPAVLVITPQTMPAGGFSDEFFDTVRRLPEARFCVGRTRGVAAELQLFAPAGAMLTVDIEPTAQGDPVLERAGIAVPPFDRDAGVGAVFSASAARKLKVSAGDVVRASIGRRLEGGKRESRNLDIRVTGVLPQTATGKDRILMQLPVLNDIQDFRDGIAVPDRDWTGTEPPAERRYDSFVAYARTLEGVEELDAWFREHNIVVGTKAREIAGIRQIDSSISSVVMIIAATAGAGFLAFMLSSMQASVRRKERMLGMMRLLGYTGNSLLLFPSVQALLTGTLGCLLAFCLYAVVAVAVDMQFSARIGGASVCTMPFVHFPVIFAGVQALSLLASLQAAFHARNVEPSAVIRDN